MFTVYVLHCSSSRATRTYGATRYKLNRKGMILASSSICCLNLTDSEGLLVDLATSFGVYCDIHCVSSECHGHLCVIPVFELPYHQYSLHYSRIPRPKGLITPISRPFLRVVRFGLPHEYPIRVDPLTSQSSQG